MVAGGLGAATTPLLCDGRAGGKETLAQTLQLPPSRLQCQQRLQSTQLALQMPPSHLAKTACGGMTNRATSKAGANRAEPMTFFIFIYPPVGWVVAQKALRPGERRLPLRAKPWVKVAGRLFCPLVNWLAKNTQTTMPAKNEWLFPVVSSAPGSSRGNEKHEEEHDKYRNSEDKREGRHLVEAVLARKVNGIHQPPSFVEGAGRKKSAQPSPFETLCRGHPGAAVPLFPNVS